MGAEGLRHEAHMGGLLLPGWTDFSRFRVVWVKGVPTEFSHWGQSVQQIQSVWGVHSSWRGTLSRDPSVLLWHVVLRPQDTQQTNLLTCHLGARMAPWSSCHWELNGSHLEEVFNNNRV